MEQGFNCNKTGSPFVWYKHKNPPTHVFAWWTLMGSSPELMKSKPYLCSTALLRRSFSLFSTAASGLTWEIFSSSVPLMLDARLLEGVSRPDSWWRRGTEHRFSGSLPASLIHACHGFNFSPHDSWIHVWVRNKLLAFFLRNGINTPTMTAEGWRRTVAGVYCVTRPSRLECRRTECDSCHLEPARSESVTVRHWPGQSRLIIYMISSV